MKTKYRENLSKLSMITILFLVITFSTGYAKANDLNNPTTGTVTDIDGNVYHIVTIGTQTWMLENLKTTKYNDGTAIPNVTDNKAWGKLSTPAYCWYNNDVSNKATYGALYNWYSVNTGKLAPAGWHVATDAEWVTLENYATGNLGTSGTVAKALAATTNWNTYPDDGSIGNDLAKNNSSGFAALPGGVRVSDGTFGDLGDYGSWWSATKFLTTSNAWTRSLLYGISNLNRRIGGNSYGFSVRCLRD